MLSAMKSAKCYVNISPPSLLHLDPKIRFHSRWSILGSNLARELFWTPVAHMELKSPQILGLLAGEAILVWCSIPAKWRCLHSLSFCLNSSILSLLFRSSLLTSFFLSLAFLLFFMFFSLFLARSSSFTLPSSIIWAFFNFFISFLQAFLLFFLSSFPVNITSFAASMMSMLNVMSMGKQIYSICQSVFYHLRNIAQISKHTSFRLCETLIHTFVTSKIDQYNIVLSCVRQDQVRKLQYVHNSAARFLTGSRKHEHITPVLRDLHWLPIHEHIRFKILLMTYGLINQRHSI